MLIRPSAPPLETPPRPPPLPTTSAVGPSFWQPLAAPWDWLAPALQQAGCPLLDPRFAAACGEHCGPQPDALGASAGASGRAAAVAVLIDKMQLADEATGGGVALRCAAGWDAATRGKLLALLAESTPRWGVGELGRWGECVCARECVQCASCCLFFQQACLVLSWCWPVWRRALRSSPHTTALPPTSPSACRLNYISSLFTLHPVPNHPSPPPPGAAPWRLPPCCC